MRCRAPGVSVVVGIRLHLAAWQHKSWPPAGRGTEVGSFGNDGSSILIDMRIKRKGVGLLIAGLGVGILVLILVVLPAPPNPEFQGKKISTWFDQLCSGVFSGTSRGDGFPEAYDAFARMGPDAVPYLVGQLSHRRSSTMEHVMLWLRKQPITRPFVKNAILPSSRRAYAAVALRRMGASAESAIPALMKAWKHDIPDVKVNCVSAMGAIIYWNRPDLQLGEGMDTWAYQKFESKVVSDAARRFPELASALQIDLAAKQITAEQDGPANRSQPIRSQSVSSP